MDTILVTGGAGFIGSNLVHCLLNQEDMIVVNLDKLTYAGNLESLRDLADNKRHIFIQGDINDRELVRDILKKYHPKKYKKLIEYMARKDQLNTEDSLTGPVQDIDWNI